MRSFQGITLFVSTVVLLVLAACGGPGSPPSPSPAADGAPAAPSNVTASPGANSILLQWQDKSDDEDGFIIYRAEGNAESIEIARVPADSSEYRDTEVEASMSYSYAVAAYNATDSSEVVGQGGEPVSPGTGQPGQPDEPQQPDEPELPNEPEQPGTPDLPGDADESEGDTASVIRVTSTSSGTGGPECTLRDAITAANDDREVGGCAAGSGADEVVLLAGETFILEEPDNRKEPDNRAYGYGQNALPAVVSDLTIIGQGARIVNDIPAELTDYRDGARTFWVGAEGRLELQDLSLEGGNNWLAGGGAVYSEGRLVARKTTFTDNESCSGGAIMQTAGSLLLYEVTLTQNRAAAGNCSGSAIVFQGERLEIVDSTIEDNFVYEQGGRGGALSIGSDNALIERTLISNNSNLEPDSFGGGIIGGGTLTIVDSTISGNYAGSGAGISWRGELTIHASSITGNRASSTGAGIETFGNVLIEDSLIEGNVAGWGGAGVYFYSQSPTGELSEENLIIRNSVIRGNEAYEYGGGIYLDGGRIELSSDSEVTGNSTKTGRGGGIYINGGDITALDRSSVFDNSPDDIAP